MNIQKSLSHLLHLNEWNLNTKNPFWPIEIKIRSIDRNTKWALILKVGYGMVRSFDNERPKRSDSMVSARAKVKYQISQAEIIHSKVIWDSIIGIRITYQTISEVTFFMKVLHFSILNNILQHEINEKPCWTELFFI